MKTITLQPPKNCNRPVTVLGKAQGENRYVRQQGEPGRFGHVVLTVEPTTDNAFVLDWAVDETRIPQVYMDSVVDGIHDSCGQEGPLSRCHFIHTRVRVIDGTTHPVDSNALSYRVAAYHAFTQAVERAGIKDDAAEQIAAANAGEALSFRCAVHVPWPGVAELWSLGVASHVHGTSPSDFIFRGSHGRVGVLQQWSECFCEHRFITTSGRAFPRWAAA